MSDTPDPTTIEAVIGSGDLGQVFRMRGEGGAPPRALKRFRPHLLGLPGFAGRLALPQAGPPALPGLNLVHSLASDAQGAQLLMDWQPAGSLRRLLPRRGGQGTDAPLGDLLALARQVAATLALLHVQGRSHSNLKPSNILLAPVAGPNVRGLAFATLLSDVGIYALAEELLAAGGPRPETLAYAAPEWFAGEPPDARSDCYGLDLLLYTMAAGYPPFEARDFDGAYQRHLYEQPAPPRQLRPDMPQELEALIPACLHKRPADRPDAARVAAELDTLLLDPERFRPLAPARPASAPPPPPPPPAASPATPLVVCLDNAGQQPPVPYPLTGNGLAVGSDPGNAIVLSGSDIAPHHVQIDYDGSRVIVSALVDSSKSSLNKQPLSIGQPQTWIAGAPLQLGAFLLLLDLPAALAAGPDPASSAAQPDQPEPAEFAQLCTIVPDEPGPLLLDPGRSAFVHLTLVNQGEQVEHIAVQVDGAPKTATVRQSPALPVQVLPGASGRVTLVVEVPRQHESLAGDYAVRLVAVLPRRGTIEAGYVHALWQIAPFVDEELELRQPRRRSFGLRPTLYAALISNRGNAAARYRLSLADRDDTLRWSWRGARAGVAVAPGERAAVDLHIKARKLLLYGPSRLHTFDVGARANGQRELAPPVRGEVEQLALVPRWLPYLLAGIVLLIAWYALVPRVANPAFYELAPSVITVLPEADEAALEDGTALATSTPYTITQYATVSPPLVAGERYRLGWEIYGVGQSSWQLNGRGFRARTAVPQGPADLVRREYPTVVAVPLDGTPMVVIISAFNRLWPFADQEELVVDIVAATPTSTSTSTVAPTATPLPAVTAVTQVAVTVVDAPPPTAVPASPTATPIVYPCEAGANYAVTGRARPGEVIAVSVDGVLVASGVVDANGSYNIVFPVPSDKSGPHVVEVRNGAGALLGGFQCFVAPTPVGVKPSSSPTLRPITAVPPAPPATVAAPTIATPISAPVDQRAVEQQPSATTTVPSAPPTATVTATTISPATTATTITISSTTTATTTTFATPISAPSD